MILILAEFGDIRRKVAKPNSSPACHIEELYLPHSMNSGQYLRKMIDLADYKSTLWEFASSLVHFPLSIKPLDIHKDLDLTGVYHTHSIHNCYNQLLAVSKINSSLLGENLFTPVSVLIASSKVVVAEPAESLLQPIEFKTAPIRKLQSESKISCSWRNPDILVNQVSCQNMISAWAGSHNIESEVKSLTEMQNFPSFVIQNKQILKEYESESELVCSDIKTKIIWQKLFYQYDVLYLKIEQLCGMFSMSCPFLECGMNLGGKSLSELKEHAKCLLGKNGKKSARKKRSSIFSSLLENLGLVKSASEISLENFNRVSETNFNKLRSNQLTLEKSFLEHSDKLHEMLIAEGKDIETSYDRVSTLSVHLQLLQQFAHDRETYLAAHEAFANMFEQMSNAAESLMQLALAPMQEGQGSFCRGSQCINKNSLVLNKKGTVITVSARLLQMEAKLSGRVVCKLLNSSSEVFVHGLADEEVVKHRGGYFRRIDNQEVTAGCLQSGEGCPVNKRPVKSSDLMLDNLYFTIAKNSASVMIQCINLTQIVTATENISCNMEARDIIPPFVVQGATENHFIAPHNIHLYITLPRALRHRSESEVLEIQNHHQSSHYTWSHFHSDLLTKDFQPLKHVSHGIVLFTPLFLLLFLILLCCLVKKYPACPQFCCGFFDAIGKCLTGALDKCKGPAQARQNVTLPATCQPNLNLSLPANSQYMEQEISSPPKITESSSCFSYDTPIQRSGASSDDREAELDNIHNDQKISRDKHQLDKNMQKADRAFSRLGRKLKK